MIWKVIREIIYRLFIHQLLSLCVSRCSIIRGFACLAYVYHPSLYVPEIQNFISYTILNWTIWIGHDKRKNEYSQWNRIGWNWKWFHKDKNKENIYIHFQEFLNIQFYVYLIFSSIFLFIPRHNVCNWVR